MQALSMQTVAANSAYIWVNNDIWHLHLIMPAAAMEKDRSSIFFFLRVAVEFLSFPQLHPACEQGNKSQN